MRTIKGIDPAQYEVAIMDLYDKDKEIHYIPLTEYLPYAMFGTVPPIIDLRSYEPSVATESPNEGTQ